MIDRSRGVMYFIMCPRAPLLRTIHSFAFPPGGWIKLDAEDVAEIRALLFLAADLSPPGHGVSSHPHFRLRALLFPSGQ
jgi:hypothetical protein